MLLVYEKGMGEEMILGLDDEGCRFNDDAKEDAYDESEYESEDQGFCVHFGLLREEKSGGVSLSYPRYCGSREFEEPLASEFALWHLEVDVEAAIYRD